MLTRMGTSAKRWPEISGAGLLTEFFPRIQFIVTTHSPYILNSVANARAFDLERCMALENPFLYSSDGLAEGY